MEKEHASLCRELFIKKREDSEETRVFAERAISLGKQIEVERFWMLDV